jgi:hypothetical protein
MTSNHLKTEAEISYQNVVYITYSWDIEQCFAAPPPLLPPTQDKLIRKIFNFFWNWESKYYISNAEETVMVTCLAGYMGNPGHCSPLPFIQKHVEPTVLRRQEGRVPHSKSIHLVDV